MKTTLPEVSTTVEMCEVFNTLDKINRAHNAAKNY